MKKIIILISVFFIFIVSVKQSLPIIIGEADDENTFMYQFLSKLILFIATLFLLKNEKIFNWDYVFKNKLFSSLICFLLVYFSISNSLSRIKLLKITVSTWEHAIYFLQCIFTGLFEEFFFRLLIFGLICKYYESNISNNLYRPVLVTSALFAIVHVSNFFSSDYVFYGVINQIMFAFLIGVFLQCVFYRFKNILLNSIIHGIINYNGMLDVKLFKIQRPFEDVNVLDDFLQSFLTFLIIGIFTVLPVFYFSLRKKEKNLLVY